MATFRYDVFLSHSSADKPPVEELARRLRAEGLTPFYDDWEIIPGRPSQTVLAEALRDSKTCAVFLGPNVLGPWHNEEIQAALDRRARDLQFHVITVLLPGTERPRRGDVAHLEFLINASWVEFLKGLDDERAFRKLVCGIKGIKPGPAPGEAACEGQCPYRGLQAFGPEDAKFFFGRENLTDWLVSDLRREVRAAQGVRFLAVLGPSGSGKSSAVLAGLVPRLKGGAIEGSEHWPIAILRPGDDPLQSLSRAIIIGLDPTSGPPEIQRTFKWDDETRELARRLAENNERLDQFIRTALHQSPPEKRLLVVVDQFEEIFTYRPQDNQARARFKKDRDHFFANLLNAAATPEGRVVVVLTMRSDFLSACAPFPQLSAVLSAHQELVGPMTTPELREAIERPAFLVGCEVEPPLIERLLADVEGQPGALPLLQFALTETWKKREVRRLTLQGYIELGKDEKGQERGIEGVLDHRANEIYGNLTPESQDLCRRLFLRLVQPGEGTEDTKRRVSYRELLPADPTRAEAVRELVQKLASRDARLITTEATDETDGAVEVAHEALIRGWTQLRQWINADRADLLIHRQLTEAAREWKEHPGDVSLLYQGTRLAVAGDFVKTHAPELNPEERAFLEASFRQEKRVTNFWRRFYLGLVTTATLAFGLLMWALYAQALRNQQLRLSEANAISRAAFYDQARHPTCSVVVAMEALRLAREAKEVPQVGDSAVEILQMEALRLARKAMKALRLAREFGGTGETSVEQDLRNILGRFHTAVVGGFRRENGHFALAADRRWLVCETEQKQVALHDLDAPGGFAPAAYLDTPPSEIRAVEVHPGGAFVATAGKDGSAHLWRYLGAGPMSAKQLIAPDLNTQHVSGDASAPRTKARRVRWSPQGAWLAVYGTDPGITLFRVGPQGIDRQLTLRGHVKPVEFVHFTPDESRLITACSNHEDRSVRVWDLSASDPSKAFRLLPPLDYRIRDVILTTDGHWLVAGDESTTLRFSPAPFAGPGAIKVQGKGGGCQQITLDPSGGFLLVGWSARPGPAFTAYRPGKPFYVPGVDVFNMQDPSKRLESVPLAFPPEANEEVASKIVIASIKIAPGGERLVIGLVGGKAYLWDRADVPDGGSPGRSLKTAGEEPVDLLEFSGDGQWLALGSTHARRIQLFHLFHSQEGSPEEILPLSLIEDHEVNLRGFKFRRSNLDLISMDENGVVRAADLRHGNPPLLPARLGGGGVALLGTAATRDANRFATWGSDHRLRIYTLAGDRFTDDELPDVVPDEEKSKVVDMAWGASYERLALATSDFNGARVQLWSVPKSGISPSRLAQRPYLLNAEGCFEPKLRWSEDGAQLAVVLDDRVEILDAARALELINKFADVVDVTFLHGHRRLLVARRKSTSLLDPATGEQYPLPGDGPALSPRWVTPGNGRVFAMTLETNPRLIRWDDDGAGVLREAASVPMHPETLPLALSGDARWLAVATRDGQVPVVRLLDAARLATSPMMELRHGTDEDLGTPNAVTFAEFLDDAPTLLTGTKNGHFRIWREATGSFDSVLLPDEKIDLEKAFYSRTYGLLYVYRNKAVELWDLSSGGVERVVRRAAGRNLSHREWRESLLRNYPYHSTFLGLPAEFDLRLMYSQSNVSSIPTSGTNLVIVANVNDVLHFRIFDADGKVVVDTDQTRLTTQAGSIEDLKRQLDGVRPPHELTRSEKDQVVTAVTSIVGHILPAIRDR